MINHVLRLIRPGLFLPCFVVDHPGPQDVLVRPRYLSICAADQRYFQGNRPHEVLRQKLPMALFHEAVGEVLRDPLGKFARGVYCVLLPGGVDTFLDDSNYKKDAFFRSSNADGFCQETLYMDRRELLPVSGGHVLPYVFTELMSVCCQGLRRLERVMKTATSVRLGIWGDGSMSYIMALVVSQIHPLWHITIFGKHDDKMLRFSFVQNKVNIFDNTDPTEIDIAIECVGGNSAQEAIADAMLRITPTGTILLMGVSENLQSINTRIILEKGLTILGTSRSTRYDFECAMKLIKRNNVQNYLENIISRIVTLSSFANLDKIFIEDNKTSFKTIIKLNI